jgi:peptide deformylase
MRPMVMGPRPSLRRVILSVFIKYFISSPRSVIFSNLLPRGCMWALMCFIGTILPLLSKFTKTRHNWSMPRLARKDPIVQEGAAVLRQIAEPITKQQFNSPKLRSLIQKMANVLSKEPQGVALAAPQVGVSLRLFVIAPRVFEPDEKNLKEPKSKKIEPLIFINPELTRSSRKLKEMSEGCLSVRGKYGAVLRHEKVTVRAHDITGKAFTYHGSGLIGHIFQHEIDHLDGILYTDKATILRDDTKEDE